MFFYHYEKFIIRKYLQKACMCFGRALLSPSATLRSLAEKQLSRVLQVPHTFILTILSHFDQKMLINNLPKHRTIDQLTLDNRQG
jgi:hypothetical protein